MKRVIFLLGVLTTILSTFSTASAYDFEVDGLYYDLISATKRTCALTSGDKPYEGVVNIPDSVLVNGRYVRVIKVKAGTFNQSNLSELTISGSVLEFDGEPVKCSIDKINIAYGDKALHACVGQSSTFNRIHVKEMFIDRDILAVEIENDDIEKITIGKNLIKFDAWIVSKSLHSVFIEDGPVPITGKYQTSITGPIKYAYIGRDGFTFYTLGKIEHLIFGKNATKTGKYSNCGNLTTVEMNNIQIIDADAFKDCKELTYINFPKTLKTIEDRSFRESGIKEFIIDCDLDNIGEYAFSSCHQLEKIQIKSVKNIKNYAFSSCYKVRSLILGEGLKCIREYAFSYNSSLKKLVLPNSLEEIGREAFSDLSLDTIVISATVPPEIYDNTFDPKTYLNCTLYVPTESIDLYKEAYGWKGFWNIKGIDSFSSVKDDMVKNEDLISILPTHRGVRVLNKDKNSIVRVFTIQGALIKETSDDEIDNLPAGLYVVKVGNKSFKVSLR